MPKRHPKSLRPAEELIAWWLTLSPSRQICRGCHRPIRRGQDIVYQHASRDVLCVICSDRQGIVAKPSKRWLASHPDSGRLE